jgi:Asp-tRNA(Asn)/Glu-tRNA(Gln) amidotransferase A subunit family amidase
VMEHDHPYARTVREVERLRAALKQADENDTEMRLHVARADLALARKDALLVKIAAMCGNHDPAEACRLILAEIEREGGGDETS